MNKDKVINDLLSKISDLEFEVEKQDKEIERLNRLISQREQKWEKWTTEKQILSSKMSDYLCKYQNIKREYTKQIKISTYRKNEIERLNNIINESNKMIDKIVEEVYKPVDKEWDNILCIIEDYKLKLQELKGENNDKENN